MQGRQVTGERVCAGYAMRILKEEYYETKKLCQTCADVYAESCDGIDFDQYTGDDGFGGELDIKLL